MVSKNGKTIGDNLSLHNMNKIYISLTRKSCLSKQNNLATIDRYYLSFQNLIPSFIKKTCINYKEDQETSYLQVEAILMARNLAQ